MQYADLERLLPSLIDAARQASRAVMAIYVSAAHGARAKDDQSPLTDADLAAHEILLSALVPLLPQCPVVSEEDSNSQRYRQSTGRFWLIDPLDGTKEFLARNGEFTVNIALIEQGRSILGVVHAPAIDCLYWGGPGLGAWRDRAGTVQAIRVQQGHGPCRVVASKSHLNAETQVFIEGLGEVQLVQAGSSLKFCRVAEGEADIYPRLALTCEWDTAAAQAVLEGAGGCVLSEDGHPLRYGKPEVLNPGFIAARAEELFRPPPVPSLERALV